MTTGTPHAKAPRRSLREWWHDRVWVPFYCRFAYFHLFRHREDGHFIVVFDWWSDEPTVDGYAIECSFWTPWGARRAATSAVFFDRLVDAVGRENFRRICDDVRRDLGEEDGL